MDRLATISRAIANRALGHREHGDGGQPESPVIHHWSEREQIQARKAILDERAENLP